MSKDKRPDHVLVDELLRGGNWRMLGIGDVVTDGDYYHHYDEKYAVPAFNIGEVIRYDVHRDYFRPVNAQPTATSVPAQLTVPTAPFPERPSELVIEHVIEVSSPSGLVKARCVKNAPVFTLSTQDHDFPSDPHIFGYDEIDDLIAVLSAVRDLPR